MYTRQILKTILIPSAVLVAEEKIKQATEMKCRPSELPIYVPDPEPLPEEQKYAVPSSIETGISTVRQEFTKVYSELKAYQRVGMDYIEQTKDNAEWLLCYLREEDNVTPKAGAIAIGGLTGFIFGLRGRFFKRTLYTLTGALGMAAVCYPKEASEYSQIAISEARKYATIAYNFAYGVKKDDPPLELPSLPKLPTSFSEAWETVSKSATSLVSGDESEQVKENVGEAEVTKSNNEIDAMQIVADVHEITSETCDCALGIGAHEECAS